MISNVNNPLISSGVYAANVGKGAKKAETVVSKQGDTSKIERLKNALDSGEYKINLQALSERIADDLL